ncbi:TnsA endonuclease N-terminal domain-containing protein [Motilimonas cestriensis]|uniref:TnsA endonuclease N-terminal domain-containing protein n=1 Tax=Motilimonas cestriensis TaxID=2742685 RepID=A0ABS8W568_9GAMM|nr:TnsA endonuclease N-terminal domain-containing protein [Motilimonas cestriensis]
MSVRKIPKNYRNLTGLAASNKASKPFFESTLERDFLTLLDFDSNVITYDVQPVAVSWQSIENRERNYTPDVLVQYSSNGCIHSSKDTVLYEIKYRSDLKKNWLELKPKFLAAISYAKERNWCFKIMTEVEIRTIYMENARFLLPYLKVPQRLEFEEMLLHSLAKMRSCSTESLLKAIFNDKWAQAELIPILWKLIASGRISTDMNIPLTMASRIWLSR